MASDADASWRPDARRQRLLAALPDTPRWVEARSMLVAEWATLRMTAPPASESSLDFMVSDPFGGLAVIAGHPARELVRELPSAVEEVIAFPDNIEHVRALLPEWAPDAVHVHVLGDQAHSRSAAPSQSTHPVALIEPQRAADLPGVPRALVEELLEVVDDEIPLAAAFDADRAVAFCYAASRSDRYWDLSIDTVPDHRRQGFAQAAARFMIHHMRDTSGLEAVWCSAASNPASTRLAERLGFVEVDRIWLLTAPNRG